MRSGFMGVLCLLCLAAPTQAQQDFGSAFVRPRKAKKPEVVSPGFDWRSALKQSFYFLSIQHGTRMVQRKTRREFAGPFWRDYVASIKGIHGWGDGDPFLTNYVGHPMEGGLSGFIQIQNDPKGIRLEISKSRAYWQSRAKAMAWAAAYSTQFEIGPLSEATIGNVGKKPGTGGWVDLVVTPLAGTGMIVAEDALDRWLIKKLEKPTTGTGKRRFYRMLFNPERSVANLLRLKHPWHRDSRSLRWNLDRVP